jgi:hypothetical protein
VVIAVCLVTMQLTSYGKLDAGEEAMKQEILARGPIVCGIACPEEFVYKYHSAKRGGELLGSADSRRFHCFCGCVLLEFTTQQQQQESCVQVPLSKARR